MKRATTSLPATASGAVRRIFPALAADVALLLVFLYIALGSAPSAGSPPATAPATAIEPLEGQPDSPQPALAVGLPGLGSLKTAVESTLATSDTRIGVIVRAGDGDVLLDIGSDERFVLASVSKVYIMSAFLDMLWNEATEPDDLDLALLEDMIRYSDNDSASTLWRRIGREEGLDAFLSAKGLPPLDLTEDAGAWGTINATPAEVSELLWRLVSGRLLDSASTAVAVDLLSNIFEEQAWGVSAGASEPGAIVMLKNGWYPESEGWRVNSAGAVEDSDGFYVVVIMAYPTPDLEAGISMLEGIAGRINVYMSSQ